MSLLRACGGPLAALLATPNIELLRADLFTFTLQDGTTFFRWTSWGTDLTDGTNVWTSGKPWITCKGFSLSNTMAVPKLDIEIMADDTSLSGGSNLKAQLKEGLFDGASVLAERLFALPPDNDRIGIDFTLGTISYFAGFTGQIDTETIKIKIPCKGKTNLLDQFVPRNVYQLPCNHAFCDPGCTLLRASFTFSFTAGGTPTPTFIPWASAPSTPARFQAGSFHATSGAASGNWRSIIFADSTGLVLGYPTSNLVVAGDTFTAFEGCDKTTTRCSALGNLQHYRGFPFVPPPDTAY